MSTGVLSTAPVPGWSLALQTVFPGMYFILHTGMHLILQNSSGMNTVVQGTQIWKKFYPGHARHYCVQVDSSIQLRPGQRVVVHLLRLLPPQVSQAEVKRELSFRSHVSWAGQKIMWSTARNSNYSPQNVFSWLFQVCMALSSCKGSRQASWATDVSKSNCSLCNVGDGAVVAALLYAID